MTKDQKTPDTTVEAYSAKQMDPFERKMENAETLFKDTPFKNFSGLNKVIFDNSRREKAGSPLHDIWNLTSKLAEPPPIKPREKASDYLSEKDAQLLASSFLRLAHTPFGERRFPEAQRTEVTEALQFLRETFQPELLSVYEDLARATLAKDGATPLEAIVHVQPEGRGR